jgi:hypothetical protein
VVPEERNQEANNESGEKHADNEFTDGRELAERTGGAGAYFRGEV